MHSDGVDYTAQADNQLRQDLAYRLARSGGKLLSHYGFDEPSFCSTELQRERQYLHTHKQRQNLLLDGMPPLNAKQQLIYDYVINSLPERDNASDCASEFAECDAASTHDSASIKLLFVSGPGGTGKSMLCKRLHAKLRSEERLIAVCASTSLAARLFEGGQTAHSLFKFPVNEDDDINADDDRPPLECRLIRTERMELLRHCDVIFWDEFFSSDRAIFEAVYKELQREKAQCVMVCSGDARQILPIVKHGTKQDIIGAAVSSSPLWTEFHKMYLTQNMRLEALQKDLPLFPGAARDEALAELDYYTSIMALSEGRSEGSCHVVHEDPTRHLQTVQLQQMKYFTPGDEDAALCWLFDDNFCAAVALTSCVLCATNASCKLWNERVQQLNMDPARVYASHDYLCECDDPYGFIAEMISEQLLNSVVAGTVPDHELKLKRGDICIVLRNLSAQGIATNQRVRVVDFCEKAVMVQVFDEQGVEQPTRVMIPRVKFKFNSGYGDSYKMIRTQIPLRLAYAMTYNKSQGQTFVKVLLDTTEEPFAHGHAYVALSRVRSRKNIRIYLCRNAVLNDSPTIQNIVYPDIILHEQECEFASANPAAVGLEAAENRSTKVLSPLQGSVESDAGGFLDVVGDCAVCGQFSFSLTQSCGRSCCENCAYI